MEKFSYYSHIRTHRKSYQIVQNNREEKEIFHLSHLRIWWVSGININLHRFHSTFFCFSLFFWYMYYTFCLFFFCFILFSWRAFIYLFIYLFFISYLLSSISSLPAYPSKVWRGRYVVLSPSRCWWRLVLDLCYSHRWKRENCICGTYVHILFVLYVCFMYLIVWWVVGYNNISYDFLRFLSYPILYR